MQGLGCARVIMEWKGKGVRRQEAGTHRNKDTPATKLLFCVLLLSKSLFFMTTHYIDVHILIINVYIFLGYV